LAAREPLSWEENVIAALGGTGIFLGMIGGMLVAFGTADSDTAAIFALGGIFLTVFAFVAWMVVLMPWKQFDDLRTPHYVGHHHDEHDIHADAVMEVETAEETVAEAVKETPQVPEAPEVEEIRAEASEPVSEAEVAVAEATEEASEVPETPPVEVVAVVAEEAPVAEETAKAPAKPDDLKVIEGIGPKTAQALIESGITTFAQIANMTPAELERVVKEEKGVRIVGSTQAWPVQASVAATGDMSALFDLQARVKGGYLYDNLTKIEGIGEKVEEALNNAGIRTFKDLIEADPENLKSIVDKAGFFGASYESWARQAQYILNDDLGGLRDYQEELKGGR
jgi:predicted flap endonuclease-1-like 5' DNA nuclease